MNRSTEIEKPEKTKESNTNAAEDCCEPVCGPATCGGNAAVQAAEAKKKKEVATKSVDGCCEPECGPTTCPPAAEAVEAEVVEGKIVEEPKKASSGCGPSTCG